MGIFTRYRLFCILTSVFLALNSNARAQQDEFKIYLLGDAGDHKETGETLGRLKNELDNHPNSAVVFLGDNSYKDILWGLVPFGYKGFDSTKNTMDKIRSQLALLDQYRGAAFFTPGNHDWWNRSTYAKGVGKLAMEEHFIEANLKTNANISNPGNNFLPHHGAYGPEFAELNHQTIRLVFIDTYRIIQTGIKKGNASSEEAIFYHQLDSVINAGYLLNQQVIVVAHHPVYAAGPFKRTLKHPYFFTRIKASYAAFPSYKDMSARINTILKKYPGIYYASGHVHALQYFYSADSVHYIVSGAGSQEKILSVKDVHQYDSMEEKNEYLLWDSGGFFEVDFKNGHGNIYLFYNNGADKCQID